MANTKNSVRRKRKYSENRKITTKAHKDAKPVKHALRMERFDTRTRSLIGRSVQFRAKGFKKPLTGVVSGIAEAPEGAIRKFGKFLEISDERGQVFVRSRHRVKPLGSAHAV